MKLCHLITGLQVGGAEMMLAKTASALNRQGVTQTVTSLLPPGPVGRMIEGMSVPVRNLGLPPWRLPIWGPGRWRRMVDRQGPDLVMAWMYHAAWLAISGRRGSSPPLIWNIRHNLNDLAGEKRMTRLVIRKCARLSSRTAAIVYNSRRAAASHERIGFDPTKTRIIPNGFDTQRFRPDPAARESVRREMGCPEESVVVGFVGRYHPHKDPDALLRAWEHVAATHQDATLVCVGRGMSRDNEELRRILPGGSALATLRLLGERNDVDRLMRAFDFLVLSSTTESFPNVVGEAMASGVPCVVTDVGDAADIVGDTGIVVPPRDPAALAEGIEAMLNLPAEERRNMGLAARRRIVERYAMDRIAAMYMDLYERVLAGRVPA